MRPGGDREDSSCAWKYFDCDSQRCHIAKSPFHIFEDCLHFYEINKFVCAERGDKPFWIGPEMREVSYKPHCDRDHLQFILEAVMLRLCHVSAACVEEKKRQLFLFSSL